LLIKIEEQSKRLLTLYGTLIRSKIDYGSIVYGSTRKSYLSKLDPIVNQALRLCLGAFRTSPIRSLRILSNESPLHLRREELLNMLLNYKATHPVHCLLPATFFSIQYQTGSYTSIELENSSFLLPTKHKQHLSCCKQTLSHSPWTLKTPIVLLDCVFLLLSVECKLGGWYRQHYTCECVFLGSGKTVSGLVQSLLLCSAELPRSGCSWTAVYVGLCLRSKN